MSLNHVIVNNLQKLKILEEHKRIRGNGDLISLLELADWAKENFQWQKLPSKATISRIIRNQTKL